MKNLGRERAFLVLTAISLTLRRDRRPGGLLVSSRVHDPMSVELSRRSAGDPSPAAIDLVREAFADS